MYKRQILSLSIVYVYSKTKKSSIYIIIFTLFLFCVALFVYTGYSYNSDFKYIIPAVCIFPLIISLVKKDKFSILVVVFSVLAFTQLIGSNTGIFFKASYGLMLLIPLSLLILSQYHIFELQGIKIYTKPVFVFCIVFILFFSLRSRISWIYHVDKGITCRLRCVHPVSHPKMRGILTSKQHVDHIEKLSSAIDENINEERNLFIYGHQPLFYYLTETNPPVKKFWVENNYVTIYELFDSLEKSIESTGKYPLMVDVKHSYTSVTYYGRSCFEDFLKKYQYKSIVNTEVFEIWTVENTSKH